jgi:hypothetical protein
MENSLWKRLQNCRTTDYGMVKVTDSPQYVFVIRSAAQRGETTLLSTVCWHRPFKWLAGITSLASLQMLCTLPSTGRPLWNVNFVTILTRNLCTAIFPRYNQQDVTFLNLFISITLYMFRAEPPPIIRSSDCTYSFWYLSNCNNIISWHIVCEYIYYYFER